MSQVRRQTDRAIRSAQRAKLLTPADAGTLAVLRKLADAIDDIDEEGLNPAGKLDNVSIPTYLRYADALGLTPSGRLKLKPKTKPASEDPRIAQAIAAAQEARALVEEQVAAHAEPEPEPEPDVQPNALASVSNIPRPTA